MFTKIKLFAVAAAGIAIAVLYAMLQVSERKREEFKGKVERKSAAIREKAHNANLKGAIDEHEIDTKPVDDIKDEF